MVVGGAEGAHAIPPHLLRGAPKRGAVGSKRHLPPLALGARGESEGALPMGRGGKAARISWPFRGMYVMGEVVGLGRPATLWPKGGMVERGPPKGW